jgi:asparagine synthase (glutamine-hydrolysing)
LENLNAYISPQTINSFLGRPNKSLFDEIPYDIISKLPFYKQLLIMDHKTYLFSLLERQDRASMGASIESRLPFLDKDLVETTVNLDEDCFFDSKQNKKVLKKICERIYGKRFTYRPKKGFPLPLQDWLDENAGFGNYLEKIYDKEFLLSKKIDMVHLKEYLRLNTFDNKLLNYGDSERIWIKWFLMVIRTAQDVFRIKDIH